MCTTPASWSSKSSASDLRVALGVLCGGYSRRMGQDKAAVDFGGESLLQRTVRRHASHCSGVLISTRADGPGTDLGWEIVADPDPGGGPLQAMLALLERAPHGVLVLPVDMPFLPRFCTRVLASAPESCSAIGYALEQGIEPLPVLLRPAILPELRALVQQGVRKAGAWRACSGAHAVPFSMSHPQEDPAWALLSTNDPAALARALMHARASGPQASDD